MNKIAQTLNQVVKDNFNPNIYYRVYNTDTDTWITDVFDGSVSNIIVFIKRLETVSPTSCIIFVALDGDIPDFINPVSLEDIIQECENG